MSQADSDFDGFGLDDNFDANTTGAPTDGAPLPEMTKPKPVYRKQPFNVYSLLLIISFVFLLASVVLLFIEAGRFEK